MELACHTYSLRACERAQALAHVRRLGFTTIELWSGHAGYLGGDDDPTVVAMEARAAGLAIGAYCIGGVFGLPLTQARDRVARAFTYARALGTDLVTGIIDRTLAPAIDRLCESEGMRFAIENHWYTDFARPRDYRETLASTSPAVGINVDTGQFAFLGCDLRAVATDLGSRTLNVHLKPARYPGRLSLAVRRWRRQHRIEPVLPGPGDGLDEFVRALGRAGYQNLLVVEHEAEGVRLDELAQCRDRALAILGGPQPAAVAHA